MNPTQEMDQGPAGAEPPAATQPNTNPNDSINFNPTYVTYDQIQVLLQRQLEMFQFTLAENMARKSQTASPILSVPSDKDDKESVQLAETFTGKTPV